MHERTPSDAPADGIKVGKAELLPWPHSLSITETARLGQTSGLPRSTLRPVKLPVQVSKAIKTIRCVLLERLFCHRPGIVVIGATQGNK